VRQVHLEEYLRRALIKEAEKIEPGPDLVPKIKAEIFTQEGRRGAIILLTKLIDRLLPGQPGWKKAVAGALCGALLVSGLTFGVSPQARAWAKDSVISPVISIVYKVVRTEDGYSVVKLGPEETLPENEGALVGKVVSKQGNLDPAELEKLRQEKGIAEYGPIKAPADSDKFEINVKKGRLCPEFSTAAEAQAHLGFPVRLPEYLPEGYKLVSMGGDKWEKTGKGFVNIHYRVPGESRTGLNLMITDEPGFLRGGDAAKEVKLGGKTAYLSEFPVVVGSVGDGNEPTVRAGHMLKWEDSGLVYTLQDSSGQLTLEEMLRIAESIK